jgi:3-hydroxyisobutyrate dehydrogenase-like beta-hydroxyacid dehydrogenase
MMDEALPDTVALIGFGEVGGVFARDLKRAGVSRILAYDPAFADPGSRPSCGLAENGAEAVRDAADAARQARLVFSCVTAGSALEAARAAAVGCGQAPWFVDVNSVSPATKREAAEAVTAGGGRYVEAAVMTSVPPHGIASPMLLGGAHAASLLPLAARLGMRAEAFSEEIGRASAVKMCRSVLIKGLEALVTESLLAARRYGVEREVLASLGDTIPHPDWRRNARYVMSRPLMHGTRRAEEMREVARTVAEAGIAPLLSGPIAERQDWCAALGRGMPRASLLEGDLDTLLDDVLARLPESGG